MLISHPDHGAYMAQSLGTDPEVVSLIRQHHNPLDEQDSLELVFTQTTDAKK